MVALVLVGILAFAAEPTTSTEADMQEGWAHRAYFDARSAGPRIAQAADPSNDLRVPVTETALAALLALLVAAPSVVAVVARVARDGTSLRWATTARRGPPAHA